jgi:hypothetical protein
MCRHPGARRHGPAAMAERVVLHIGAPKSGTTFLQTVLWHNRERLREQQVLVPVRRRFDFNLAAVAVRGVATPAGEKDADRVWGRMLDEVAAWPGTAVISCEWFVLATADQARRALSRLAPAEVHLVYTARAFDEQVPAAWQETLKLGRGRSLAQFIESLEGEGRWTWASLDPAVGLERWGATLPPRQVHVVTTPRRGSSPGALWERFAQLCGIDPDACDTSVARRNESLGAESARLLQLTGRRLRKAARSDPPHWSDAYRWIRGYVGHELLVPRGGSRIALRAEELAVLQDRAARSRSTLEERGVDIVGDLDELTPTQAVEGRHPGDVTAEEMLDIAGEVMGQLLERVRHESERADRAERRVRKRRQMDRTDEQPAKKTARKKAEKPAKQAEPGRRPAGGPRLSRRFGR